MSFRFYRLQLDFACYQSGLGESPITYSQALQCFESGVTLESALDICRDVYFGLDFTQSFNAAEKEES